MVITDGELGMNLNWYEADTGHLAAKIKVYTHTYIHTYIRTYIHTYIHTYTHTHLSRAGGPNSTRSALCSFSL